MRDPFVMCPCGHIFSNYHCYILDVITESNSNLSYFYIFDSRKARR